MVTEDRAEAEDCVEAFKCFSRIPHSWSKPGNILEQMGQQVNFDLLNDLCGLNVTERVQNISDYRLKVSLNRELLIEHEYIKLNGTYQIRLHVLDFRNP